jgi:ribosomal protein S18 acetylase RimI-like enzyme
MTQGFTEVSMIRDLSDILSPPAPEDYTLRWYRPGDEAIWLGIHRRVGIYDPVSPDLFRREFGDSESLLSDRQCYLIGADGAPVGTITGWTAGPERAADEGRVHWLAVVPEHQRRGLGKHLTLTACARLRELGADTAYLTTGSENLPAIRLYLGLGFRAETGSEEEARVWKAVARRLDGRSRSLLEAMLGDWMVDLDRCLRRCCRAVALRGIGSLRIVLPGSSPGGSARIIPSTYSSASARIEV